MRIFILYAGAGLLGTAVHYTVFLLLAGDSPDPGTPGRIVWASTTGAVLGAGTNYLLNRRVFASARPHAAALPRFAVVAGCGLAINAAVLAALVALGAAALAAQLAATAAVLGSGFVLNRYWTFSWPRT